MTLHLLVLVPRTCEAGYVATGAAGRFEEALKQLPPKGKGAARRKLARADCWESP